MNKIEAMENLIKAQFEYIQAMNGGCVPNFDVQNSNSDYILFKDYVNSFLEKSKSIIKKSSYYNYQWALNSIILPYFKNIKLNEFNSKKLQEFANFLLDRYSIKSSRDIVAIVKNILHSAEDEEIILPKKYKVKFPKNKNVYNVLAPEDYEKLYNYCIECSKFPTLGIILAMCLGLRIGEVCGLKWEDIDFKSNSLEINRSVNRLYNSSTNNSEIFIGAPKTAKSKRKIYLTEKIVNILKLKMPEKIQNIYIISGREKPLEPRNMRAFFDRLLKKLNIEHIKFHELRHTFATRAIENNIDPKTVAEIMGHENCNITLDIYTNCTEKMMRNAIEQMEVTNV